MPEDRRSSIRCPLLKGFLFQSAFRVFFFFFFFYFLRFLAAGIGRDGVWEGGVGGFRGLFMSERAGREEYVRSMVRGHHSGGL